MNTIEHLYPVDVRPSIRKTFKYNPDYAYLDDWVEADWTYSVTHSVTHHDDDLEESVRVITTILTSRELDDDDIHAAFQGELAKGCSCEYDCCGHYFGGLSAVSQLSRLEWRITASYSRNY